MRVKITLACTECKQRNYNTMKNKKIRVCSSLLRMKTVRKLNLNFLM